MLEDGYHGPSNDACKNHGVGDFAGSERKPSAGFCLGRTRIGWSAGSSCTACRYVPTLNALRSLCLNTDPATAHGDPPLRCHKRSADRWAMPSSPPVSRRAFSKSASDSQSRRPAQLVGQAMNCKGRGKANHSFGDPFWRLRPGYGRHGGAQTRPSATGWLSPRVESAPLSERRACARWFEYVAFC